jgi:beta-N-acetylhexosaminidase
MKKLIIIVVIVLALIFFSLFFIKKNISVPLSVSQVVITEDPIRTNIKNMTIEQKIGQMFLVGNFSAESNDILGRLIIDKKIGSVILLNQNIKNQNVLQVTSRLQEIASSTHQPLLLISVDQEGGIVSRIKEKDSNLTAQNQIDDDDQAYQVSKDRGLELLRKGVNVNFSPVLENIINKDSFLYNRVFRGQKEKIISLGSNMVQGYQDAGIAATVKHYPGHDDSSVDSHKNLPVSTVENQDFYDYVSPFIEVIKNKKPLIVMMAHVLFPNIDPVYPATLSPVIINQLRNEYGFDGVIITDDMNMGAITKNYGIEQSAIQAIKAGNDILLHVSSEEDLLRAYNAVLFAIENNEISQGRIDESVYRILKLKEILNKYATPSI